GVEITGVVELGQIVGDRKLLETSESLRVLEKDGHGLEESREHARIATAEALLLIRPKQLDHADRLPAAEQRESEKLAPAQLTRNLGIGPRASGGGAREEQGSPALQDLPRGSFSHSQPLALQRRHPLSAAGLDVQKALLRIDEQDRPVIHG